MTIIVLFFGVLAEVTRTPFRQYSNVNSFADLKLRITDDFPELVHYNYRISVNHELVNHDPLLKDGDQVAYMPRLRRVITGISGSSRYFSRRVALQYYRYERRILFAVRIELYFPCCSEFQEPLNLFIAFYSPGNRTFFIKIPAYYLS